MLFRAAGEPQACRPNRSRGQPKEDGTLGNAGPWLVIRPWELGPNRDMTLAPYAIAKIGHLIASNQVSASQAMTDIGSAVSAQQLTADQAISVLTGVAGQGSAMLQAAVGGEIASLISNHQITAAQAMADTGSAVTSHALTADQAVGVLAGEWVQGGDASFHKSFNVEVVNLVQTHQITSAQLRHGHGRAGAPVAHGARRARRRQSPAFRRSRDGRAG